MGDTTKEKAIRDFISCIAAGNVDKALLFFDDDCEWVTNEGTFQGKMEIATYLNWMISVMKDIHFHDDGVGILIEGDNAVYQHIYEGKYGGKACQSPGCLYL